MEFDRKTILAFALILGVLILVNTDSYKRFVYGDRPMRPVPTNAPRAEIDSLVKRQAEDATSVTPDELTTAKAPVAVEIEEESFTEQEIFVETPLYNATFSTRGGTIKSWRLKNYTNKTGEPVTLVREARGDLAISLPVRGDTLDTGRLQFRTQSPATIQLQSGETRELVFERELQPGKFLRKQFLLVADSNFVGMSLHLENLQDVIAGQQYLVEWQSGLESTEKRLAADMQEAKGYYYLGSDVEKFDVGKDPVKYLREEDRDIAWAAIRTKYFAVAVIPQRLKARGVSFEGRTSQVADSDEKLKRYAMRLHVPMPSQASVNHDYQVYIGPLQYETVKQLNVNLEQIMNLGWGPIQPFSKLTLWALTALHKIIPNYGLVIILFTFLIKLILHPLTKKSYQSMAQMQALQPKLKELQEKHKDEPQKLQSAMMNLYRDYGVNPMGGCLPMILQMPLLFALFTVFGSTIEFRQAPFFGWITDLSAPDTIFTLPTKIIGYGDSVNVLPIFMCVTMFFQQKMSVTDPKQKFMIYFMPIFFLVLFNNFPSGLNLYYALFNVLSIIQQKITPKPQVELQKKTASKKAKSLEKLRKGGLNAALSRKRFMK